jgi:alpha-methylacyl-CoA racemase
VLEDITVLDLSSVGPAARASRWLADYGARVIKVAPPPSRGGVQITPPFHAYSAHRGMERTEIDLKTARGVDEFLALTAGADVVIESFRPGVVDRLGIGYDTIRQGNPGVVYCSTTGYGQDGPHAQWAGHDLNYLGVGGFLDCSGRGADDRPPIPGATVADSAGGGMHAVMSILAALVRRSRTGEGAYLDVSIADGVLALMALAVDDYLASGEAPGPGRGLLTGRYACYGVYGTKDDRWVTVAAIEPRFWANVCRLLGLERWTKHQTDDTVQHEIRADMEAVFRTRTRDAWVAELAPADTCVAPVLSVPEVVGDDQFVARGAFIDASHRDRPSFRQVGYVLAGSGS